MNVFITGTSSGLGFGLATFYLKKDYEVYGISRRSNAELEKRKNFHFLSLDLTDFKEVEAVLPQFLHDVKSFDLVILNAGVLNEIKDMRETSLEEIKEVMDVNVWANKILIEALFQQVDTIRQMVAISSGASVNGSRGWNSYSLSKATLNMLIKLYAREFTQTHFCALAPGLIDTNMQDYIYGLSAEKENLYPAVKKLKQAKGTAQMPSPDEAAEIVARGIEKARNYESGAFLDVRSM